MALRSRGYLIERIANHCKIVATACGKEQALLFANEQLDAKCRFQRLDLLAHCTRCHIELFSRSREAPAPCGGLERPDGVEWWKTSRHQGQV